MSGSLFAFFHLWLVSYLFSAPSIFKWNEVFAKFRPNWVLSNTHRIKHSVNTYSYTDHLHVHKYKYINQIYIFFVGWLGCYQDGGGTEDPRVSEREQVYRPLGMRFIPKKNKVPRVLIHLLFLFSVDMSWLRANSIAMTALSDCLCVPLLMCSATGDSSVFQCVISYRSPLIVIWRG